MAWLTRREGETYRFLTAVGSMPELMADAVRLFASKPPFSIVALFTAQFRARNRLHLDLG